MTKETKPPKVLHPIRNITNEKDKKQTYNEINQIILGSQFFFLCELGLFISLGITSQSLYYWIFYALIPAYNLYSTLKTLFRKEEWTSEEIEMALQGNVRELFTDLTPDSVNWRALVSFISSKFLRFCLCFLIWGKPMGSYLDKFAPPTNSSSCTTEYLRDTGNYYNPNGYFSYSLNYTTQIELKFCTMNQTYSYPNFYESIIGYEHSPLGIDGVDACANPLPPFSDTQLKYLVNGFADISICWNRLNNTSLSYKSPVLGLKPPITAGSQYPETYLCKGNSAVNVCISNDGSYAWEGNCTVNGYTYPYRLGKPKMICPACLNAYRRASGDIYGPPGYSECAPYDPDAYDNPFCWFCPGRGYGFFATEKYDNNQITLNLWLTTWMLGLIPIDLAISYILFAKFIDNFKKKKVTYKKDHSSKPSNEETKIKR